MTKIIMNGCNGKMGQVITRLVAEDPECEIVAGFDVNDSIENTYPVFTDPEDFTADADVVIDFSHPSALTGILNFAKTEIYLLFLLQQDTVMNRKRNLPMLQKKYLYFSLQT